MFITSSIDGYKKTVPSVYTIYQSHSTQVAEENVFKKFTIFSDSVIKKCRV